MSDKKTILVLADDIRTPSGVGSQTRYFVETLIKTGRYKFICLGGAIRHADYTPVKLEQFGDDLVIFPVDGYGTQEMIRAAIKANRVDLVWFMTDPRFWGWLWSMDNEVRVHAPMVYHHVWDNTPYPMYNRNNYLSNDSIVCISKVTHDIVKNVAPEVDSTYLPHAVNEDVFKKIPKHEVKEWKDGTLPKAKDKMVFFWNNRNARRKQSGTLIFWFKEFIDKIGHDKAMLLMHTDPKDPNGQDLNAILRDLDLQDGQVMFSTSKMPMENIAMMYNMADCTINISDAEGFGLGTLESLSCGTPIIVNMTGGLQEQVTDGENWFGIGIEPASRAIIGSQTVPYIYEDRVNKDDFLNALTKMYEMSEEDREKLGELGMKHVRKNYNFKDFCDRWVEIVDDIVEKHGSWETRKNYSPILFEEV